MDTFALIIHPINPKSDISRKFPLLGRIASEDLIHRLSPYFPSVYISEITGITSTSTGKEIKGWFLACPLTPRHILELPEKRVYRKIIETGHKAERLGANILGLGAYTSVVGDAGRTIAQALDIPVTTGDSYTVSIAIQAVRKAAQIMHIPLESATAAVVGATGAIGRICAEMIADEVRDLYLVGLRHAALEDLRQQIVTGNNRERGETRVLTSTSLDILKEAQLIITVTSTIHPIIQPEHLQPGSVVCDVSRPRNVSAQVAGKRDDVLVIDGGIVDVPGAVNFHFDFWFPPGKAYACMAETMALVLEGRFENFSLGKELTRSHVEEITGIAEKHGFRLSGFRSFEREISGDQIERIRQNARSKQ